MAAPSGSAPREIIFNFRMILTAMLYATSAVPLSTPRIKWSSGTVPSLKGFQQHFDIDSGSDAGAMKNFVSLAFMGSAVGAALSFLVNDRIGRLWSFRLYVLFYTIGQMIETAAPDVGTLYAARIISGLGVGALTVTGPMSLVEIAPAEIRGLITTWFPFAQGLAHCYAVFCVYGITLHVQPSRLQYQIVFFTPCIYLLLWVFASFFLSESPRWLFMTDRADRAVAALHGLRGLPMEHPHLRTELEDIRTSMRDEVNTSRNGYIATIREAFTEPSNLRRVQQSLICYALPQFSGANTISSYFVPILGIIGVPGGSTHRIFLTGMYTMARFFFALITSFFLIDALGRRTSLFLGITLQMAGEICIGAYLKTGSTGSLSPEAQAAIAMIFIHSFGCSAGKQNMYYD